MPTRIKALHGSCVIIPCRYDYNWYPPSNPNRVVWYQYVSQGYPLVYDNWYPSQVMRYFIGRTSRSYFYYNSRECSLKIDPVNYLQDKERIYPWVDPENVGRSTYRFFDTTVFIDVVCKCLW